MARTPAVGTQTAPREDLVMQIVPKEVGQVYQPGSCSGPGPSSMYNHGQGLSGPLLPHLPESLMV